jgi:hypothetical protein
MMLPGPATLPPPAQGPALPTFPGPEQLGPPRVLPQQGAWQNGAPGAAVPSGWKAPTVQAVPPASPQGVQPVAYQGTPAPAQQAQFVPPATLSQGREFQGWQANYNPGR